MSLSPSFDHLLHMIAESARRGSALHGQFLQMRRESMQNVRALIEMQIRSGEGKPSFDAAERGGEGKPSTERSSAGAAERGGVPASGAVTPAERGGVPASGAVTPAERGGGPASGAVTPAGRGGEGARFVPHPALFDSRQLDEFGTGKISACLGPAFAKYDTRRIPRIPNGDLKMMSRVTAISGCPGDFESPASVTAEYDVPADVWYFRDSAYPAIPGSLWMEIALQPCGFLSAYLDTYALMPYDAFYFRNLDGSLRAQETIPPGFDLRGKTIVTRAVLLSHTVSGGTVIQKYAFEISCSGRLMYAGESIFGYFSVETMANQVGLDGGRAVPPAYRSDEALSRRLQSIALARFQTVLPGRPHYHLPVGRLHLLDEVYVSPDSGRYGKGYIYARSPVNPRDWYYPFHFYQDPVMPGSLGVEAILEAMQGFAIAHDLGRSFRSPCLHMTPGHLAAGEAPMTWRYRGQITQQHRLMELDVHLSAIAQRGGETILQGDANLWVDGLRIYELKNAAIGISEG